MIQIIFNIILLLSYISTLLYILSMILFKQNTEKILLYEINSQPLQRL